MPSISELVRFGFRNPDRQPLRVTRLILALLTTLALSGCGVGESNQEAELKSRYCEIPSNGNSGLNLQANSAGTFLTVKVQPSNDLQQMAEGIVYVDTSPEKLQQLKALDLSKEYWIRQFPDVDNIGIWCNYVTKIIGKGAEARELPFLKSFSVVTYKNGQYIVLAELLID